MLGVRVFLPAFAAQMCNEWCAAPEGALPEPEQELLLGGSQEIFCRAAAVGTTFVGAGRPAADGQPPPDSGAMYAFKELGAFTVFQSRVQR